MTTTVTVTIYLSEEETIRRWHDHAGGLGPIRNDIATVSFRSAPGDRGTEIHADVRGWARRLGRLGKTVAPTPQARVKDELRRFKRLVEASGVARSDNPGDGDHAERELKERAQPMPAPDRDKVA